MIDVPMNVGRETVCTPMVRSPIDTTSAWMTPKKPSNIHRPHVLGCRRRRADPLFIHVELEKDGRAKNAPIHSARFVNRGAIADP